MKNNNTAETIRTRHAAMLNALQAARNEYDAGRPVKISISAGNVKMGAIASVSTLPLVTCPACCWDTCAGKCYAAKIATLRPNVRTAYARNTVAAVLDMDEYFHQINEYIAGVRFFRFHVSGDIVNKEYFSRMVDTARNNPHCKILAFTKRAEIVNDYIARFGSLPDNLKIIFSNWGNAEQPNPYNIPVSNVIFAGEEPADNWKICGGNCYNCACRGVGCWELKNGETIAFYEH